MLEQAMNDVRCVPCGVDRCGRWGRRPGWRRHGGYRPSALRFNARREKIGRGRAMSNVCAPLVRKIGQAANDTSQSSFVLHKYRKVPAQRRSGTQERRPVLVGIFFDFKSLSTSKTHGKWEWIGRQNERLLLLDVVLEDAEIRRGGGRTTSMAGTCPSLVERHHDLVDPVKRILPCPLEPGEGGVAIGFLYEGGRRWGYVCL